MDRLTLLRIERLLHGSRARGRGRPRAGVRRRRRACAPAASRRSACTKSRPPWRSPAARSASLRLDRPAGDCQHAQQRLRFGREQRRRFVDQAADRSMSSSRAPRASLACASDASCAAKNGLPCASCTMRSINAIVRVSSRRCSRHSALTSSAANGGELTSSTAAPAGLGHRTARARPRWCRARRAIAEDRRGSADRWCAAASSRGCAALSRSPHCRSSIQITSELRADSRANRSRSASSARWRLLHGIAERAATASSRCTARSALEHGKQLRQHGHVTRQQM